MSNLLVQNIKHTNNTTSMTVDSSGQVTIRGENSATTTNLQQGLCKSWILIDGTGTMENKDSHNVSGIVDNGTGDYSKTMTNPMNSIFYAAQTDSELTSDSCISTTIHSTNPTTTVVRGYTYQTSFSQVDSSYYTFVSHGDLA